MPELPEVETVRRGIDAHVVGRTIETVRATGARSVRRAPDPRAFEAAVQGLRIDSTDRLGKYLLLRGTDRDGEHATLVVHLRMSGQLRVHVPSDAVEPHTHVVLGLGTDVTAAASATSARRAGRARIAVSAVVQELRFVDPRTFGELYLTRAADAGLAHIGPDALLLAADRRAFADAVRRSRRAVKAVLLDQGVVAGIGNIYADEACFRAGVRPGRPADELTGPAAMRLADATLDVLRQAVDARGSSLADARYVDVDGLGGTFQHAHAVYARGGQPCRVCATPISRGVIGGRSAHWCRRCQR